MNGFGAIILNRAGERTLQVQLADQVKKMIQAGELRAKERLPSTRALAERLQVSRNTVVAAYEGLHREGYLESAERSRFTVGTAAQAFRARVLSPRIPNVQAGMPAQAVPPKPFRPAQPDVDLFPLALWNRLRTRVLRRGSSLLQYQSRFSVGLDELRQVIAEYLRASRGVRCHWQEIAITSGSQQALFLLGHLLLDHTRSVYFEDPGYPGARRSWEEARATIVPAPLDEEGLCLPLPPAENPALIYVTPSHQFPLGTCMSLARRLALLQVAQTQKLLIVEDDYDSEFRYTSPPQPSLQSLDQYGRVIYVGSFSKTLFPGLRIGFVVLPPRLVESFHRTKAAVDDYGPLIDQATLAAFIESGAFYAHLRRCRKVYRERQELFLELSRKYGLPLEFPITGRGMNLAGHLTIKSSDRALSRQLAANGLDIPPLSGYAIDARTSGFLLGVTAFDAPAMRRGVQAMARSLQARPGKR